MCPQQLCAKRLQSRSEACAVGLVRAARSGFGAYLKIAKMGCDVVGQACTAHLAFRKQLELVRAVERHVGFHGLNLTRQSHPALECHSHLRPPR